jgi:hypothetical protein
MAPVRYPNHYVWLVFLSALDIMFTRVVLHVGGTEANPLAMLVISRWGLPGMVIFKFLLVSVVILLCETVGRRDDQAGRRLCEFGIVITCVPVLLALLLLLRRLHR